MEGMEALPFFSQHAEDVPEAWRPRACGVTALRMALARRAVEVSTVELVEEGVASDAYQEGIGWRHDGLVALAKRHGARAYRKEFRAHQKLPHFLAQPYEAFMRGYGERILRRALSRGETPIVSLTVDGMADTHLVPLQGYGEREGESGFFYNDPARPDAEHGENLFMSEREFRRRFRRLAIFVA